MKIDIRAFFSGLIAGAIIFIILYAFLLPYIFPEMRIFQKKKLPPIEEKDILYNESNLQNTTFEGWKFYFVSECPFGKWMCGAMTYQDYDIWIVTETPQGKKSKFQMWSDCQHEACHNTHDMNHSEEEAYCSSQIWGMNNSYKVCNDFFNATMIRR